MINFKIVAKNKNLFYIFNTINNNIKKEKTKIKL